MGNSFQEPWEMQPAQALPALLLLDYFRLLLWGWDTSNDVCGVGVTAPRRLHCTKYCVGDETMLGQYSGPQPELGLMP